MSPARNSSTRSCHLVHLMIDQRISSVRTNSVTYSSTAVLAQKDVWAAKGPGSGQRDRALACILQNGQHCGLELRFEQGKAAEKKCICTSEGRLPEFGEMNVCAALFATDKDMLPLLIDKHQHRRCGGASKTRDAIGCNAFVLQNFVQSIARVSFGARATSSCQAEHQR